MVTTQRNDLGIIVYAPVLVSGDGRPLALVRAMERAFPALRLEWTISDKGKLVSLPERDVWVARGRPDGEPGFPLVCNGGKEDDLITLSGMEILTGFGPGGQPLFDVHASLPLNVAGVAAAGDVLESLGESSRAFWGEGTPFRAAADIAQQTQGPASYAARPPRGLPALKPLERIRSPAIPSYLGWLNYWSDAAARAIGFPDPVRDSDLLLRARRTPTGSWVVRLTDEPLDLDNPAHLDALLRAYERFPEIGGRSTP
jgi:hypothetical protein